MKHILPTIVFAQFAGTSLWFAGNAVLPAMVADMGLSMNILGDVSSAVQLGFITGTLIYAIFNLADRYSPRRVFLMSASLGALMNLLPIFMSGGVWMLLSSRFFTGFFLAGIYPVGMKIAADYFQKGLGRALGYLVGALVVGTAFPYFLDASSTFTSWRAVLAIVSVLAVLGAFLLFVLVSDGPYRRPATKFHPGAIVDIFRKKEFRMAAFGYFGHMWELYAFWTFVPIILVEYFTAFKVTMDIALWSFLVIGVGFFGCVWGGSFSRKMGSARVAFICLTLSLLCCLISPLRFSMPSWIFMPFILLWGMAVVGDSPQFSTLNARTAPVEWIGTALTIATCIGFAITIASIQMVKWMNKMDNLSMALMLLGIGPLLGLMATWPLVKKGY